MPCHNPPVPVWAQLVAAAAALRVAVGLAFYLSGLVDLTGRSPIPVWAYALLSASFAAVGGGLLIGNKRDARAAWLGGVLVLLAVPLSERLISQDFAPTYTWIARLRPHTFLPAFLWYFVVTFPSSLQRPLATVAATIGAGLSVFGLVAFTANLSPVLWPLATPDFRWPLLIGQAPGAGSVFWRVTLVASLLALTTLLVRLAASRDHDRFRLKVFVGSLVLGLAPLFIEVIVEESWPAFKTFVRQPAVEPWVALLLFTPMAAVPLATAYSVLYDGIVEMKVVLRLAAQYLLAKTTVIAVTMVPFLALGVFLFQRRTESLATLLTGPRPVALIAAIAAGALALRLRRQWLHALDRRYFREQHDTQVLLTHLMTGDWLSQTPRAIAEHLATELEAAFHARADLYVIDLPTGDLRRPDTDGAVLGLRSMLATLLSASPQPMDVDMRVDSPLARLPDTERQWLQTAAYVLLVPLRGRSSDLIGLLALGCKRSELPYSESDRRALAAIATPVSLAIENNRLRSAPGTDTPAPATECLTCARLHANTTAQCSCGGTVAEAPAPHILRGVFQFERRIGAGGMGVVYIARDLALQRQVAIKTLPQVSGPHQARLRAEAHAMASIVDPNLAVVYGIESWRGMPFLIEEYLDGGTLADRLTRGPLPIADAVGLGVTLAATLARLHAAGLVHCDIKPSNIGFTASGVPKLIDFGLVHLLQASGEALTTTVDRAPHLPITTIVTDHGLIGTPPYMSPEALRASRPRPDFDVWALSVVLFEAIAGRRPFVGRDFTEVSLEVLAGTPPDIRTLRPDCDDHLARFFAACLARDAVERPATAATMEQQLLALRATRA